MSIRQPMDVDVDWTWIGYVDYNYVNVCHGSVLESERANLRRGATKRQLTIATHIMTADAEEVQITVCSFIMTGHFLAD